jgi:hypothetical protein
MYLASGDTGPLKTDKSPLHSCLVQDKRRLADTERKTEPPCVLSPDSQVSLLPATSPSGTDNQRTADVVPVPMLYLGKSERFISHTRALFDIPAVRKQRAHCLCMPLPGDCRCARRSTASRMRTTIAVFDREEPLPPAWHSIRGIMRTLRRGATLQAFAIVAQRRC